MSQSGPRPPLVAVADAAKRLICRHCKVEVVSKKDLRAILGKSHGKHCPRRFK